MAFYQGATTRDTATPRLSSSRLHASEILERVCGLVAIQYDPLVCNVLEPVALGIGAYRRLSKVSQTSCLGTLTLLSAPVAVL